MRIGRAIIVSTILALGLAGPAVVVAATHAPAAHSHVIAASWVYHHD
jgi:hypothetical protein